ncbi:variant erythrocyte surface antigen-1 family protein [Babesia caballi]|uniref:Variant erythrocyte surface antigen-1 family protein n=1 Tax=Babesia caballi TaxID=5871 RepID=A0AAV4LYD6_BABCB|nr:variant erythrocyte surface antigen-1 family protein [Babesia caballi]
MGRQKNSLTDWPEDLKDTIDWLALVGGGFGGKSWDGSGKPVDLETALMHLSDFEKSKDKIFGQCQLQGVILKLANGLGYGFLGYSGNTHIEGSGIAQSGYQSTYKDASWNGVSDSKNMALIFLGSAVVAYYCIGYLYWRLNGGGWKNQTVSGAGGTYLNSFLLAMGYSANQLSTSGTGGDAIMEKVAQTFEELEKAGTSNDYPKFLKQLEKIEPKDTVNRPLASCFLLAEEYFKKQANAQQINVAINNLKQKFEEFSQKPETPRADALNPNYYEDANKNIADLLKNVSEFEPKEAEKFGQGVHHTAGQAAKEAEKFGQGVHHGVNQAGKEGIEASLDCPSNLKEAIDWILRVTGKDGGGGGDDANKLAEAIIKVPEFKEAIKATIKDVTNKVEGARKSLDAEPLNKSQHEQRVNELGGLLKAYENLQQWLELEKIDHGKEKMKGLIKKLATGLQELKKGVTGVRNWSAYNTRNGWENVESSPFTVNGKSIQGSDLCAMIFLGCIPLYYHGFTYLYWQCRSNGGEWAGQTFKGDHNKGYALHYFMTAMGFSYWELSGNQSQTGQSITVSSVPFDELSISPTVASTSYSGFLKSLHKKLWDIRTPYTQLENHPIAVLFLAATAYFQQNQGYNAPMVPRPPSSIREILYFLAALPLSRNYYSLKEHIESIIPESGLQVADSGKRSKDPLTRENINDYITTTCSLAPAVINLFQGSEHGSSAPFLYELFSNGMKFTCPSGPALLFALSNYTYALQFQLQFLYKQCENYDHTSGGWQSCWYGPNISSDKLETHFCPSSGADCSSTGSPLQAFLTDNLKGFHVNKQVNPLSPDHLENHPPGFLCHVPMGFAGHIRQDVKNPGLSIKNSLNAFCGGPDKPLRQLSEKLSCLTKRTPRILGDIFGFYVHLFSQLFNNTKHVVPLNKYVYNLLEAKPIARVGLLFFKYLQPDILKLGTRLYDLVRHCHNPRVKTQNIVHVGSDGEKACSHPGSNVSDLFSLYINAQKRIHTDCYGTGKTCGPYLSPLAYTIGTTFADDFASTYLSWIVYLTDDFETGIREMIENFEDLKCTNCTPNCHTNFAGSTSCSCNSIPECAGVLPLLYLNGFSFYNANSLNNNDTTRTCYDFHTVVNGVINGNPLNSLVTAIDDFLFLFRYYFLGNLSAFWTIYICLILYTFFFLLDTLHMRSHLKLTSSHVVPPLSLLTSGTPLPVTKLTYIGQ